MIVVALTTFCVTATLFLTIPTRSLLETGKYNPWADLNDDGTIDILDAIMLANVFGTSGTPINKTVLYDWYAWQYGLVGRWKLDEGTGNVTADSSGNSNYGTLVNDPTWVDGKFGKALHLNGTNYVTVADSETLEVQNFTLEAWIYMTRRPYEQSSSCAIIHKFGTDAESSGSGYMLRFRYPNSTDDKLTISTGWAMAGERVLLQYNSVDDLTLDQWHHIVGTSDGYTIRLYIDGVLKASETYSEAVQVLYWKSFPLVLGAYGFNGAIDNVMIYNRALSVEEVMYHYVLPPP